MRTKKCRKDIGELEYKHQDLTNEYDILREEIRGNSRGFLHISTFALPITIAVLVTTWELEQGAMALINLVLVYSLVAKQMKYRESTFRNATYCIVFLEPYLFRKWETRLNQFQNLEQNDRQQFVSKFEFLEWFGITITSWIVFVAQTWGTSFLEGSCRMYGIFLIAFIMLVDLFIKFKQYNDTSNAKREYITRWKQIKKEEEQSLSYNARKGKYKDGKRLI